MNDYLLRCTTLELLVDGRERRKEDIERVFKSIDDRFVIVLSCGLHGNVLHCSVPKLDLLPDVRPFEQSRA